MAMEDSTTDLALANTPTEEVVSPTNFTLHCAMPHVMPHLQQPGVGASLTLLRANQYGVADSELASVVENLAETAHRTRVEEVEAMMNSHYSNEVRMLEVAAACQASNFEAQYLAQINEPRNRASRSEAGTQRQMLGQCGNSMRQ